VSVVDVLNEEVMPGMETLANPGITIAVKYSPPKDFVLGRLEWWVGRGVAPKLSLTVGIREDYNDRPGKKLAEKTAEVTDGPNWYGADFNSPVALEQGAVYWLTYKGVTSRDSPPIVGFTVGGKPALGKAQDNEMFIPPFAPEKPEGKQRFEYFASLDDVNWVFGPHYGAFKFRLHSRDG